MLPKDSIDSIENRNEYGWQHIADPELLAKSNVDAHAENQRRPYVREIGDQLFCHKVSGIMGSQSDAAFINQDG